MVVKNKYFIVLMITLSLFIGNSEAGWKFWKKDKEITTTTSTTSVSINVQSTTVPSNTTTVRRPTVSVANTGAAIIDAANLGLDNGVDKTGKNIQNNIRSNLRTELGTDIDFSRSNRSRIDRGDAQSYRNLAVDLIGAKDSSQKQSSKISQGSTISDNGSKNGPKAANVVADVTTRSATDSTRKIYSSNPIYSKGNIVTDEDLEKVSEALYIKETNNANSYIRINLQKQTTSSNLMDQASQPLLTISPEAFQIPTIQKVLSIFDNYQLDTHTNEYINPSQREEESLLVDTFLSTNGKTGSTGFEHVFMAETRQVDSGTKILGLHNWIYFNAKEIKSRVDYLGYIKKTDLGNKGSIIKMHVKFNGHDKPVTTMFIGTSPELEMSLYTVCFYARPDESCPVSLGGTKFNIITRKFRYRGKDLVGTAYPEI
ncbi:poly(U)-specific endoribonuclease homolog isoform X3 [Formica exsecta]|uniref:poly(U)-specific endoribonuclease homolog isoform X3 n=1 Tax=Formica exsecta TaxID=72781 RepID=UPI001144BECD|nr:poly(U)-specific endoribonuclease homolog isoform X3 [Formica exsecta]